MALLKSIFSSFIGDGTVKNSTRFPSGENRSMLLTLERVKGK